MKRYYKVILFLLLFLIASPALYASAKKKDKKEEKEEPKKEVKKDTPYTKLFKKKHKTVEGLITLHKIDGKVYFEFPKDLLKRKMLLGSMIESISNSDYGVAGQQPHTPLCIYFTNADSAIQIRSANFVPITDEENIQNALDKNNIGAILSSFDIKATSPDSTAVVFDATSFFVNGNKDVDPFSPASGLYSRKSNFKSDKSQLCDIMAYSDNVSITSYLSYEVTSTMMGFVYEDNVPATALMKRSLVLLPEEKMQPRINDPRIGVFYNGHTKFSGKSDGVKPVYYANRWRLEPKDTLAFKQGKLTEPVKPITFYIDPEFPPNWLTYIDEGIKRWNKAYEKVGFKNAIVTKMYPLDDPDFDPNNLKYSCIKYAPTATQNSMGPSWVDPRTGEILSASVYLYHGVVDLLSDWLFIQTSVADKRVRTQHIPEEIIGEGLRYITAHEIGHCLGLMHNMGASFAFPVDSLRSPSFTQKYGTTPSIMDYARFNFIAQKGDLEKGVKLTPPELGVYDYYVIKWLYSPLLDAETPEDEIPILEKWISEKIQDPMYRYGKQQIYSSYDPSAQTEDLGDDQIEATRYMFNNLKYILGNLNDWVKDEDKDMAFRKKTTFAVINIHFYWYLRHVLANIGGIYLHEKYEGDQGPAYESVPKEVQRESVLFLLDALENLDWMNTAEVADNIDAINLNPSEYLRSVLFPYMMRWVANIGLSEVKASDDPYTREECIEDVFGYVWGSTIAGKRPTPEKLSMQKSLVKLLIDNSKVKVPVSSGSEKSLTDYTEPQKALLHMELLREIQAGKVEGLSASLQPNTVFDNNFDSEDVEGFGFLRRFVFQDEDITHVYYGWLLQNQAILKNLVPKYKGDIKSEYQYLLLQINNALKVEGI